MFCDEADAEAGAVQVGRALGVVAAVQLGRRRRRAQVAKVRRSRILSHQNRVTSRRRRREPVDAAQRLRCRQTSTESLQQQMNTVKPTSQSIAFRYMKNL